MTDSDNDMVRQEPTNDSETTIECFDDGTGRIVIAERENPEGWIRSDTWVDYR